MTILYALLVLLVKMLVATMKYDFLIWWRIQVSNLGGLSHFR